MGMPLAHRQVLCLPGLQGHRAVFAPLVRALGDDLSVTLLDLPPGSPIEAANALKSQLEKMPGGPWHVVAGSYGGLVGLHLDAAYARSLSLVGTCPVSSGISIGFRVQSRMAGLLPGPVKSRLYRHRLYGSLRGDGVPSDIAQQVADKSPSARVLSQRLKGAMENRPGPPQDVPLLWVRGDYDAQITWDDQLVHDHWPDARIVSVPGGHRPFASHARALAAVLRHFWRDYP
jgi:pimeloyl-ACP methyl ester carboxylesterase